TRNACPFRHFGPSGETRAGRFFERIQCICRKEMTRVPSFGQSDAASAKSPELATPMLATAISVVIFFMSRAPSPRRRRNKTATCEQCVSVQCVSVVSTFHHDKDMKERTLGILLWK